MDIANPPPIYVGISMLLTIQVTVIIDGNSKLKLVVRLCNNKSPSSGTS